MEVEFERVHEQRQRLLAGERIGEQLRLNLLAVGNDAGQQHSSDGPGKLGFERR